MVTPNHLPLTHLVPGPNDPNNPDNAGNPGNVLDLVPFGLTPVAVFPPFRRPRTPGVDAVAVIWREPSGTVPNQQLPDDGRGGEPFRKKRDLGYCPEKTLFEKLLLNIRCYKPRLDALFGKNSHGKYLSFEKSTLPSNGQSSHPAKIYFCKKLVTKHKSV